MWLCFQSVQFKIQHCLGERGRGGERVNFSEHHVSCPKSFDLHCSLVSIACIVLKALLFVDNFESFNLAGDDHVQWIFSYVEYSNINCANLKLEGNNKRLMQWENQEQSPEVKTPRTNLKIVQIANKQTTFINLSLLPPQVVAVYWLPSKCKF